MIVELPFGVTEPVLPEIAKNEILPVLTEKSIAPEPFETIVAELSVEVNDNVLPRETVLLVEPAPSPLAVNDELANLAFVTLAAAILSVVTALVAILASVTARLPILSTVTAPELILDSVTLASNILAVVTASSSIEAFKATAPVPLNEIADAVIPPPVIEKFCELVNCAAVLEEDALPVSAPTKVVDVTEVKPANVVDDEPKLIVVEPTVTEEFASAPFGILVHKPVTSKSESSFKPIVRVPLENVPPVENVSVESRPVIDMSDSKPPLVTNVIVPAAYVPPVMNGNSNELEIEPVPPTVRPQSESYVNSSIALTVNVLTLPLLSVNVITLSAIVPLSIRSIVPVNVTVVESFLVTVITPVDWL